MPRRRGTKGKFPSLKMKRMIGYESLIELDCAYLLDYSAGVTSFQEQPFVIRYRNGSQTHRYTPDFYAVASGQQLVIECKPQRYVYTEENQRIFLAARDWCAANQMHFLVVTDEMLRQGHRLENVKLLTDHARYVIDLDTTARLLGLVMNSGAPLTIAELMVALAPSQPHSAIVPILHLSYHHQLHIPLDEAPITTQSTVTLPRSTVRGNPFVLSPTKLPLLPG